jgi:hypothetical protein
MPPTLFPYIWTLPSHVLVTWIYIHTYIHTYTHTFTDPISTQIGLNMEFIKNRVDCNMQSSQNTEIQSYIRLVKHCKQLENSYSLTKTK